MFIMTNLLRRTILSFTFVVLSVSAIAAHANVASHLPVSGEEVVTRGDFIRAAVKVLNISYNENDNSSLPYLRVSRGMVSYVAAASRYDALDAFGFDLQLGRPISRGQAASVIAGLLRLSGSDAVQFKDARPGTPESRAVSTAVTQGWMEPLKDDFFGVRRVLQGQDALLLLRRAAGESAPTTSVPKRFQPVQKTPTPAIKVNLGKGRTTLPKAAIMNALWNILSDEFLYTDRVKSEEAAYSAMEAIVNSLEDPYTRFLRPTGVKNLETQIKGSITGIGAQVEYRDGVLTVVTPLRGSPAEAAGVKPNDEILKADGTELKDLGFMEAVELVRGPEGSTVKLTIRRNGIVFDLDVVRAKVSIPEVEISWRGDIVIVELLQFGNITETELRPELTNIQRKDPKGLVLDLRNNPGGLLGAAKTVLSNFLSEGSPVATIVSRDGERKEVTSASPTIASDVPIVVLVNEGSASASEIVAGALQDAKRATVVGTKTFGKGTVQSVLRFTDDSGLKMTIAEWLTPDGRKIDQEGVHPDIVVEFESERDEQMLRALELLR